jgi:hypothetical protein
VRQKNEDVFCAGALAAPERIPLDLRYSRRTGAFEVALRPASGELWRVVTKPEGSGRALTVTFANAQLARLRAWWPRDWPRLSGGHIDGDASFSPARGLVADFALSDLAFANPDGSHAGEKIALRGRLQAGSQASTWRWQARLDWLRGDVYWQPFFVQGGEHYVEAGGTVDADSLRIEAGRLVLAGIAATEFSARVDRRNQRLASAVFKSADVDVTSLYERLLKPALQGTAFGDLRTEGRVDVSAELNAAGVRAVELAVRGVSIEDRSRRFAVFRVEGRVPWHREDLTAGRLRFAGGELLKIPFGAFDLGFELRGIRVRTHDVDIPVLDGKLSVKDFAANGEREGWRWRFAGGLTPVSMEQITAALGVPVMHGTLSSTIPTVSYRDATVRVEGELLFKVFDGTVVARDLTLETPFGKVPRLSTDLEMKGLDLDLVTRAYSFGQITGRIDARIAGLEFVNWDPVRFDATIASSPGEYPKRISQTAVQNISALGGAGAAAAIQRSFLRFFDEFRYSALGLSCKLENGVCLMNGIEAAPQGYVIVKGGGGIPTITVLGYNRRVGWNELVQRLKRITADNVKPVIK